MCFISLTPTMTEKCVDLVEIVSDARTNGVRYPSAITHVGGRVTCGRCIRSVSLPESLSYSKFVLICETYILRY